MNGRAVYTFPMLRDYARIRRWMMLIVVVTLILGAAQLLVGLSVSQKASAVPEMMTAYLYTAGAATLIFAIAAGLYVSAIGRALQTPARIATLDAVIAAQLWFWRISCLTSIVLIAVGLVMKFSGAAVQ